jgi:PAS domain S-box-containing protein
MLDPARPLPGSARLAVNALAQVARHAEEGIAIVDAEQRFLLWSPYMERLAGKMASEVVGRLVLDVFPGVDASAPYAAFVRALAGEVVHMPDRRAPQVAGSAPHWFSMTYAPLRADDGTVDGVIVLFSDVTTRKLIEQELQDRENRLKAILLSEPECVKLVARDCTLIEMNPAGLAMVEAESLAELVGRDVTEVVAEPYRTAYRELHARVFTGRSGTLQLEIVGLRGTRRWVETHATPLIDADGNIAASLSVTRDISERRRAEHELREARERTSRALDAAGMGIWEIDLDDSRCLWVENAEAVLGSPLPAPLTVGGALERVHADDRDRVERALTEAVAAGSGFTVEYRVNWPDGTLHWACSAGWVSPAGQGRPARMVGVTTDVTERRSLEEQLRQSQKMEAIGRLAGGVAHDFNNLLTVIHGYSRLLAATCAEDQKADLHEVIKAAERAAALTRQLLAFSRRQVLKARVLDLNAVVPDLTVMLQRLIGEQLELVPDLGHDLGMVRADLTQLEQVIMNLVVNARDAMPRGGRIVISTSNAELETGGEINGVMANPGRYVRLAVRDTGEGMGEEVKARIFEPFFTTKSRTEAAGLGLSTVYGIVLQSGGHLRVDSVRGRGTVFEVWLPRVMELPPAQEMPPADDVTLPGSAVVLVAEDETSVRRLARRILENAGYRVLEAGDPAEAETVFAEHGEQIELLLTDIVMPGGTGPELFGRLKARKPSLKAVCMSAYAEASVLSDGRSMAGAPFLQKPFSAPALVNIVQRALDERTGLTN